MDVLNIIFWLLVILWLLAGVFALLIHYKQGDKTSSSSQLLSIVFLGPISFPGAQSRARSICIGMFIAVLAFVGFSRVVQTVKLTCTRFEAREPVNCIKQTTLFGVIPFGAEEIYGVEGATLVHCDSCEGGGYRVELLTAQGNVPLNSVYYGPPWIFL